MSKVRPSSEPTRETFAFIDRLERLSTIDDVTRTMERALARFGIESFIVTGLSTKERAFEKLILATRLPAAFLTHYIENDYARFDPIASRCIKSHMPFEWEADSYRSHANPRVAEIMRLAADFGLRQGYIVPIHGPNGYEACVSMVAAELDLSARAKAALHLMALYAFDRVRRLRGELPGGKPPLTAREREVLAWAALGKSAAQISETLKIAKRTVDEHTQTAVRRLGAANRTQAVAIALRDRIIDI
jgi:LuxR family transcriptional regulator, quorum-sensing system regulator BjaR1